MLDDRDLMLRFCSLGQNCEFGFAQRAYGADPIDLLRWASTPLPLLRRLLQLRFAGIERNLEASDNGREIMVKSRPYGFTWHAHAKGMTPAEVEARETKRLPFLARKLMEDIAEGERIFVIKPGPVRIEAAEFAQVLDLLDTWGGRPTLLAVYDGGPPAIEHHSDRLLIGRVNKFADGADVPGTTIAADWLALCRMAHLERRHIANSAAGVSDRQTLLHSGM
jgi:hypothetical protein